MIRAYYSMPSIDFIAELRDAAIRSKASPLVIDQIDSLGDIDSLESEVEAAQTKADEMESDRDDLRNELNDLIQSAIDNLEPIPPAFLSALRIAAAALERHGYSESDVASIKRALEAP